MRLPARARTGNRHAPVGIPPIVLPSGPKVQYDRSYVDALQGTFDHCAAGGHQLRGHHERHSFGGRGHESGQLDSPFFAEAACRRQRAASRWHHRARLGGALGRCRNGGRIDRRGRKRKSYKPFWSHAAVFGLHQRERGHDREVAEGGRRSERDGIGRGRYGVDAGGANGQARCVAGAAGSRSGCEQDEFRGTDRVDVGGSGKECRGREGSDRSRGRRECANAQAASADRCSRPSSRRRFRRAV